MKLFKQIQVILLVFIMIHIINYLFLELRLFMMELDFIIIILDGKLQNLLIEFILYGGSTLLFMEIVKIIIFIILVFLMNVQDLVLYMLIQQIILNIILMKKLQFKLRIIFILIIKLFLLKIWLTKKILVILFVMLLI